MVNLGGGFPAKYLKAVPGQSSYANAIHEALTKHFGNNLPETIIEPGRGMVGNAGVIKAEVVLISKKHADALPAQMSASGRKGNASNDNGANADRQNASHPGGARADNIRWVFLDIGKFGGLAETMEEAIRYPITTPRDGDAKEPCVIAGPTCDSADVLYEKTPYPLPITLLVGDEVLIEAAGAYTTTYSAVAFNGFPPLKAYVI
jgi:ornithine decarboxylase